MMIILPVAWTKELEGYPWFLIPLFCSSYPYPFVNNSHWSTLKDRPSRYLYFGYQNMNIFTPFVTIILNQSTRPLKSLFKWHIHSESSLTIPCAISTTIYIPKFPFHTTFYFFALINQYILYILLILFVNYFPSL